MRLPEAVEYVIVHIMQSGGQAYLVGGALRDRMLGRTASDYDIATSFPPEKIEEIFQKEKTYLAGKRFGTVTVAAVVGITGFLPEGIRLFRQPSSRRSRFCFRFGIGSVPQGFYDQCHGIQPFCRYRFDRSVPWEGRPEKENHPDGGSPAGTVSGRPAPDAARHPVCSPIGF